MTDLKARSAETKYRPDMTPEQKSAMRQKAYDLYGVIVLERDRLSLTDRVEADRMFAEQQREDQFHTLAANVVRIR